MIQKSHMIQKTNSKMPEWRKTAPMGFHIPFVTELASSYVPLCLHHVDGLFIPYPIVQPEQPC